MSKFEKKHNDSLGLEMRTDNADFESVVSNDPISADTPDIQELETAEVTQEVLLPVLQEYQNVAKPGTKQAQAHIAALVKMTEFTGQETKRLDNYVNQEIVVVGAVMHPATVRSSETDELIECNRVIMLLDDGSVVSAVSVAVESFFTNLIFPAFGVGRWEDANGKPIKFRMKVTPVATKSGGRSYNLRVLAQVD